MPSKESYRDKCHGADLKGCPNGGGDAVSETKNQTWKGHRIVYLCEKCGEALLESKFRKVHKDKL